MRRFGIDEEREDIERESVGQLVERCRRQARMIRGMRDRIEQQNHELFELRCDRYIEARARARA